MNLSAIISETQAELLKKGFEIDVDGVAGPQTWKTIYKAVTGKEYGEGEAATRVLISGTVDERSEKAIKTLLPEVQPYARALILGAKEQGIKIVVTSATRTYDEQNELFAQGRTKPGKIVTKARGGQSNHNFGIAFDVTIFDGSDPIWESPAYKAVGAIGRSLGLSWGGDWKSILDEPHFELRPKWAKDISESEMLAQLRTRHDKNAPVFA